MAQAECSLNVDRCGKLKPGASKWKCSHVAADFVVASLQRWGSGGYMPGRGRILRSQASGRSGDAVPGPPLERPLRSASTAPLRRSTTSTTTSITREAGAVQIPRRSRSSPVPLDLPALINSGTVHSS
ncbi:hypothetical protein M758_6G105200 [Ceratodon purpureus]|nr:hypothetical protein M758_6G105200 [Ceratodon purpureus]